MKKKRDLYFSIKYILLLLTVICLGMMVVTYAKGDTIAVYKNALNDAFSPVQTGIRSITGWFSDRANQRREKEELLEQIDQLKNENSALYQQISGYQDDYIELMDLRRLLKLTEEYTNYDMIGAKVIGKESGAWFHKFTINRGSLDGIELDMNVLAAGGLCGIITDVAEHSATVTSILDDQMNVTAMSKNGQVSCMVMGDLALMEDGRIRIMYVSKEAEIKDMEKIVTSSTSSKYLPGILIGYAVNIAIDSNSLSKSGYLIPVVDFDHIDNVLVIRQKK